MSGLYEHGQPDNRLLRAHFHHHAAGRGFWCIVNGGSSGHTWVKVKIEDDQGGLSLD
ncbi:hypothetical protein [Streptomyces sp. NPDC059863]|uniref:hypothetical protein n=1 Tax=unclassified Streptomyces TaxID=2593676 RepID=UPI00365DC3E3